MDIFHPNHQIIQYSQSVFGRRLLQGLGDQELSNHLALLQKLLLALIQPLHLVCIQFKVLDDGKVAVSQAPDGHGKAHSSREAIDLLGEDDSHAGSLVLAHKPVAQVIDDGLGSGEVGAGVHFIGDVAASLVEGFLNEPGIEIFDFAVDNFLGDSGYLHAVDVAEMALGVVAPHCQV